MQVDVVDLPGGGCLVLPPPEHFSGLIKYLERRQAAAEKGSSEALVFGTRIKEAKKEADQTAELKSRLADRVTSRSFELRAYTRGQRLEARRLSTEFEGRTPRFDRESYELRLGAMSAGMPYEEFLSLPGDLPDYLAGKAQEISEPDPERLDFFE